MVYFAIRYHKAYKNAWIIIPIKLAFNMILLQSFILSVIAIARIPVSSYMPTLVIMMWILQLISETLNKRKKNKSIQINKILINQNTYNHFIGVFKLSKH